MISIISFIVVIFGCLNWLSIGFFQYDLVAGLFGYQGNIFSRIVYIIVGIAAIYLVYIMIKNKGRLNIKKEIKEEQIKKEHENSDKTTEIAHNHEENARNHEENTHNNEDNTHIHETNNDVQHENIDHHHTYQPAPIDE